MYELSKKKPEVFSSPKINIKSLRCKLMRSGAKHIPISPTGKIHRTILDGLDVHSSFAYVSTEMDVLSLHRVTKPKGKPRSTILTILSNS